MSTFTAKTNKKASSKSKTEQNHQSLPHAKAIRPTKASRSGSNFAKSLLASQSYEQEADRVAKKVSSNANTDRNSSHASKPHTITPVGPISPKSGTQRLDQTINQEKTAGNALDLTLREEMESQFSEDFSKVRIHRSDKSSQLNDHVNAKAFTHGNHIFFNKGQFQPHSQEGKTLLAHELTHVLQQRGASELVQRQDPETGVSFWFSVQVDETMGSDRLLLEFVMQYRQVDEQLAQDLITNESWHWRGEPEVVTEEHVAQGYRLIEVYDGTITAASPEEENERREVFRGLPRSERQAITRETDRQFWERTQYRPGEQLGNSADDRRMAEFWMTLRSEIIRQRIAIRSLPEEIRDFIFSEAGPSLQPADYQTVLRIADKLMQMTPEERASYLARTTASTTDLAVFEASIDRFQQQLEERFEATMERTEAQDALLGLDEIYERYLMLKQLRSSASANAAIGAAVPQSGAAGTSIGMNPTIRRVERELTAALQPHGYQSIAEFEAALQRFRDAFRDEAVFTAMDMLDRYDHLLWSQQERYREASARTELHGQLSSARSHVTRAHEIRENHAQTMVMTPQEMAEQSYWSGQFQEELATARSDVQSLSDDHPLLSDDDLPFEDLALANEQDTGRVILDFIEERRNNVQQVRQAINDNANIIWDLDLLLPQAMAEQGIREDSLYHKIIQNQVRDTSIDRTLRNLAIAIFAIAAGLVSMGTGTIAVLGAGAAFGVSSYQAWEEYQRYELQHAAHGAQLLSDDPSIAWVVVAIVGAGIDLGGVAAALRPMRAAVNTFNETSDLVRLEQELATLTSVNQEVRAGVMRAAQAEAEARAAWETARRRHFGNVHGYIDPIVTPAIHLAVNFAYPVYLQLRRGIIGLENFLRSRQAISLIGDMNNLSPQQLARVRDAYRMAMQNSQRLSSHGFSLGMTNAEVENFLLAWNRHPDMTVDDMIRNMDQWAEPLVTNPNARSRLASDLIIDDATRARMTDFDQQIAGTGGIESIRFRDTGEDRLSVTIEGEVLPGRLTRNPDNVSDTTRRAPDFNSQNSMLFTNEEAGLSEQWQRLHLWGPGFGDEAAAGMMWGPRNVNLVWQNDSIESYIRELAELSQRHGGRTRVRATAISWENPTPSGWQAPHGEHFLKSVEYDITLIRPGQPNTTIRVSLDVAEPPGTTITGFDIDPASAINLGDLFE